MAFIGNNFEICTFCSDVCIGTSRHVLVPTHQHEQKLKTILPKLDSFNSQLGSYPTCDMCRRMLETVHNIPESCFQNMPNVEVADSKVEPDLILDNLEQSSTIALGSEMQIKGENGEIFFISELMEEESNTLLVPATKKTRRRKSVSDTQRKKIGSHTIRHRCPFCQKGFADKSLLVPHIRRHTGEKPYKCDYCGKGFCESSKLKLHIRTHTGERPYPCPHCPKAFRQSGTLRTHIRVHTKETPYVCEYCDRAFTQSYNLTIHLRNQHNKITIYRGREVGRLPVYNCVVCNKNYRSLKCFKLHEKLHSTGKLFDCTKCGKKYTFVHKCRVRDTNDETEKMYPCRICGQEFKHLQSVVYHMSSKHNQLSDDIDVPGQEPQVTVKEEITGC
ncbi:zinc finger protein 239-like [Toxorhynchites rutilus septentrionalis]|uniref:zinc finger protein 239-like n=1 Tax=Toxorhynchites rutilus septentrionalis TaxID=329112 RepID=UPI002479CA3C|nr:zinc finger protein 239-like [Toxorhynchites rutilus septentrionalis]